MASSISRAEFLRGDFKHRTQPVRPPWALPEREFQSSCISCGDCLSKCPNQIIEYGRGRMPVINFDHGECSFCGECAKSCPSGAIQKGRQQPWLIKANIEVSQCLAFKSVECRSCEDACETRSIRFTRQLGDVSRPTLDASTCSGCGACYSVCPVGAIQMRETESFHESTLTSEAIYEH